MAKRVITALFDTLESARGAEESLVKSGMSLNDLSIVSQITGEAEQQLSGLFGAMRDLQLPEEDRAAYAEGLRRGGYVLIARVDEEGADNAVARVEACDPVDLESRSREWRNAGWQGAVPSNQGGRGGARVRSYMTQRPARVDATPHQEAVIVESGFTQVEVEETRSSSGLSEAEIERRRRAGLL
jgi:hypothetical protein